MKDDKPYTCDYCGRHKGEINHWWLRPTNSAGYYSARGLFTLIPWADRVADQPGVEHICGQECASKSLAKWMADA